jgi:hypothetical protein
MADAPILFLIFNRPDTTAKVFDRIKQQKPKKLYVAADGARDNKEGEIQKCEAAKQIVLEGVNWDCEVQTLFRKENLGCGMAVSQAISWFFNHEEYGIILEDDCVPNESFFTFCNELLIKYANENRIMMISGGSFQNEAYNNYSYYYSSYIHIWGWATWRRAWQHYDFKPDDLKSFEINKFLKKAFRKTRERKLWIRNIHHAIDGTINTWDYQWMYAIWKNNGLSIVPWKNFVSNIGYGTDATHTTSFFTKMHELPTHQLDLIQHPEKIIVNKKADKIIRYNFIINNINLVTTIKKVLNKLHRKLKHI